MTKNFQIAAKSFRYTYRATDMRANGATVYKCRHGQKDKVLLLSRKKNGRWVCHECHEDSPIPVWEGKKIFQTKFAIDDITNPGDLHWMWYDTRKETWMAFDFRFRTTWVEDEDEWLLFQNATSNAL